MHTRSRRQLAASAVIPLGLLIQLLVPLAQHASAATPARPARPASLVSADQLLIAAQSLLIGAERGIPQEKGVGAVQRFLDDRRWAAAGLAGGTHPGNVAAAAGDSPTATGSPSATPVPPGTIASTTPVPPGTIASTTTATQTPVGGSPTPSPTQVGGSVTASPTPPTVTPTPPTATATVPTPFVSATATSTPTVPTGTATPTATRTPVPLIPNTAPFTGAAIQNVARAALPDVVLIGVHGPSGLRTGTGFVIRSDASGSYALTTRGTLGTATAGQVTVMSPIDGRSYPALVVQDGKGSPGGATDLGIVRFAAKGLKALRWADSEKTVPGQPVLSLAYSPGEGGPPALYEGIVSAVHRDIGDGAGPIWIQHQTPLDAKAGGAPLLDLTGAVVGINVKGKYVQVAGGQGQLLGVYYAAPADSIRASADALIAASRGATLPVTPGTTFKGSGFTLTLPSGWARRKTSGPETLLVSADTQVVVSVQEQDVPVTPTDAELKKQIAADTAALGKSLKLTFSVAYRPIAIGALHGVTGIFSASDRSINGLISYLSDGQHLLQVLELYPSGTPQSDLDQASALVGSIVATGGGTASGGSTASGSPTPTPQPGTGGAYKGKGFSARLPGGWSGQKLKDGTPVIVSDDGAVVVQISEDSLPNALTDDQIRAVITKVASDFSKQDGVTFAVGFSSLHAGALHGIAGTLTAAGKPTIRISVLENGTQVVNVLAVFDPSASQADHDAYDSLIGSISVGSTTTGTAPGDGGLN